MIVVKPADGSSVLLSSYPTSVLSFSKSQKKKGDQSNKETKIIPPPLFGFSSRDHDHWQFYREAFRAKGPTWTQLRREFTKSKISISYIHCTSLSKEKGTAQQSSFLHKQWRQLRMSSANKSSWLIWNYKRFPNMTQKSWQVALALLVHLLCTFCCQSWSKNNYKLNIFYLCRLRKKSVL